MPSKSAKQAKFMAAVANNPKFANKAGVPQSVGQEFANADKRNKDMPNFFDSTKSKPGKGKMKYASGVLSASSKKRFPVPAETNPLRERTGPEKVVLAILDSSHASRVYLSACRQPGAVRYTG